MLTPEKIFAKIKEISIKYLSGNPSLDIESIAYELKANVASVQEHIAVLEQMGLVVRDKKSDRIITLTEKGRASNLL